jgi:hypothetical protein
MKKIIGLILFLILMFPLNVNAGNATISVRANKTTLIVGNSLAVTVTVSADTNIGAWEFDLKYDTSKLRFISSTANGGTSVADVFTVTGQKTKSYTFNFTAIARGTANLWITGADVLDVAEVRHTTRLTSQTITILTQAELEASYSKNNYLKSLEVEGYTLNPVFNKDTLKYTVMLPPETKEAIIKASVEDSKSSIDGIGTKELVDGDNEFKILVEAQNGSERTYTLNIVVEELDPIIVKVNDIDYTVVRKKQQIECPNLFEDKDITYSSEIIPGCFNETTDFSLIALKDTDGNTNFFIFDNDDFKPYKEVIVNRLVIYPSDMQTDFKLPKNSLKKTINISGEQVVAYQLEDDKDFYLIYAKNMETGKDNIYLYDSKEMTMQRHILKEETDNYFIATIILAISSSILLVSTGYLLYKQYKRKKKLNKVIEKKIENNHKDK